jgi:hypothetical protein
MRRSKPGTFDIAFLGNDTKDTIVSAAGTRIVDGGAFNYGAHAAARMGLRVAAIARLAREDWRVVEALWRGRDWTWKRKRTHPCAPSLALIWLNWIRST